MKLYINMNKVLTTKPKKDTENDFIKLMNNPLLDHRECKKYRDIRRVANNRRICYLELESNYHPAKWFSENVLAI